MNSKSSGRPAHLSLVKELGDARILSVDNLGAAERQQAEGIVAGTGMRGVLVGLIHGEAPWDVRPMVLSDGALHLIRLTDPAWGVKPEWRTEYELYQTRIKDRPGIIALGQLNGQYFVRRTFFQATSAEMWRAESAVRENVHPVTLAQKILQRLAGNHAQGVVHGHICFENIVIINGEPEFIDFGFYLFGAPTLRRVATIAPELTSGQPASVATDLYGLGLVFGRLLSGSLTPPQKRQIDAMLSSAPHKRPDLGRVADMFDVHHNVIRRPPDSGAMHSGRLLSAENLRRDEALLKPSPQPPLTQNQIAPVPKADLPRANLILVGLVTLLVFLVLLSFNRGLTPFGRSSEGEGLWPNYWGSNQPSLMREVAEAAAFNGDELAQSVIISDALKGTTRPLIRSNLLRIAFNPLWEADLSRRDRQAAIQYGTAAILPKETRLPPLAKLHPAVVLALAATLEPNLLSDQLKTVAVGWLGKLPGFYGAAFGELARLGSQTMADPAARALAQLVTKTGGLGPVETFLVGRDAESIRRRSRILLALAQEQEGLVSAIWQALKNPQNAAYSFAAWFDQESVADWAKIEPIVKLLLIVGGDLPRDLGFERVADLFRFPVGAVQSAALNRIRAEIKNPAVDQMLIYLAGPKNHLTRLQTVALITGTRLKGDAAHSFVSNWFASQPDPENVIEIVLARQGIDRNDPFNFEAARYLKERNWRTSLDNLKRLTAHPEPLIRALAYSRLDPRVPAEAELLNEALLIEPSERMKAQLRQKLSQSGRAE